MRRGEQAVREREREREREGDGGETEGADGRQEGSSEVRGGYTEGWTDNGEEKDGNRETLLRLPCDQNPRGRGEREGKRERDSEREREREERRETERDRETERERESDLRG